LLLVVVNGAAGAGRGAKIWRTVSQELDRRGAAHEAVHAASGAAACEAVRARIEAGRGGAAAPVRGVAVIGGDGSVHAVLPALAGTDIPLGVIPAGSGNDTARAFRLPVRPEEALDRILAGHSRAADLIAVHTGTTGAESALTAVASGFDADVAGAVNRAAYKRWCNRLRLGPLAYVIGVLDRLRTYRPQPVTVQVDGAERTFEACWMAAIANTPSYGGGLRICPEADPADGMLDVCVVHSCSPLQLLRLFPTLLTGTHVKLTCVTMLRGARVELRTGSGGPLPAALDGETLSAAMPLRAEASAGGIRLFI